MKKNWFRVFLTVSLFGFGMVFLLTGWMIWTWTKDPGWLILGFILLVCAVLVWGIFPYKQNRTPRVIYTTQKRISQEERKVPSDIPIKEQQTSIFCPKCGLVIDNANLICTNCGTDVSKNTDQK
ncbi:MAG: hypothetical protein ACTSQC_12125 [Candidatus Heimdallarchaeaceae archaeon]